MPRRRSDNQGEQLAAQTLIQLLSTRQGRIFLLVVALLALIAYGGYLLWQREHRVVHPAGPTVRIATWNLHQFSERPTVDLRRIAEIISTNHFDIIAIQEVKKEGQEVDNLLNVLGYPWRSSSFSPITGNHERFAFIYNGDHVQELGPAEPVPLPGAQVFDRSPYEDTFKAGNFDFTLVTAHLFYGKNAADHLKRQREVQTLATLAKELADSQKEKDVIVLGDFNEENARPNLHFFDEAGWQRLIHDPTNLSSTEDFDNILIDPAHTKEWSGTSGVVNYDEIYHYERKQAVDDVSDHRPAWADFATTGADDD